MLPLVATLALLQTPLPKDEPPRLRTVLENNSIILVEPMPKEKTVSVQLFASAKYVPETEATHGYRHLLEHLIARGDGQLDRKLETAACFLKASTLRDAMQIEIVVGPEQVQLALDTLAQILKKPTFTQEQLDTELKIMRGEFSLVDEPMRLSSAVWTAAYGEGGLDPLGTFDSIYRATPEKLSDTFDRQFAAEGLVISIAGPVDLDKTTSMAKAILAPLPKSRFAQPNVPRKGSPGSAQASADGECLGAIVPGYKMPQTMAALAAGLALASELPSAFVIYTPTVREGLVILGRSDAAQGLSRFVDGFEAPGSLFGRGRSMAREWVMRQLRTPSGVAFLRGLLLSQGSGNRPETMLDTIDSLTLKQFEEGVRSFTSGRAASAAGAR